MAEFSLGLTKTAVEGTVSLVKSAVEEEKQLRDKVRNDLVFISGELEMMQSFLRSANKKQNQNAEDDQVEEAVRLTSVRQLRSLAFDVEDCVENVVHLDLDDTRRGWLRRVWHRVNSCRAPPLPLDEAVAEISQLKARVEDVSQRNTRYNNLILLHGSISSNDKQQQPPAATVRPLAEDATTYHPTSVPAFHILRDAWKATGTWRSHMCSLQEELLIDREDDNGLQVISVWGSTGGDLGTASIFRKAYRDPKICENFKIRAWVKLTNPFNHDEFVKSLLVQLYASSISRSHQAEAELLVTQDNILMKADNLMEQMREQRYLVVLEDVSTLEDWDVIRIYLPDSNNGSRVVLSTPQFGIALVCTGEPYQVSKLRKFPAGADSQFLCAFFKKKTRRNDKGEFYRQLRRQGVISVWGGDDDDDKSNLIDILHKGLINGWFKDFEGVSDADKADHVGLLQKGIRNRVRKFDKNVGFERDSWVDVEFERHSWVDVPHPLDLKVFAQHLFLNFHSDDIRASEIKKDNMMGEAALIRWCRESLFEKEDCFVVINGLQSTDDWDSIKSNFLLSSSSSSSKAMTAKAGCILVITKEETVATHCVKDQKYQVFNVKDLKADTSISTLINKGTWSYGIRGMKGRLFYDRSKDALEWTKKFNNVGGNIPDEGKNEEKFGVFAVGTDDLFYSWRFFRRTGILRYAYYGAFQQIIERRTWVDVPHPFDLMDFSWRLLLDFYSDDIALKEAKAVGLMEGIVGDPIQECLDFLRNKKCLVVINGLRSKQDWDSIKHTFLREHIQSIVIVNPLDRELIPYCNAKVLWLGTLQGFTPDTYNKEYDRIFYTGRCQKALEWTKESETLGREIGVYHSTFRAWIEPGLVHSVWGIFGVGKSTLVRNFYYAHMLRSLETEALLLSESYWVHAFKALAWVDVPSPFNLSEFAWRLLLDFYSDDPQAKQTATVSMMEQGQDPILECCKILQKFGCLVVIDGLRSTQDWDLIEDTFLSSGPREDTTILVITNEEKVAMRCVGNDEDRVRNVRRLEADAALSLFEKMVSNGRGLTSEEKELSKTIVPKCGGLPKVIAAIGEVCRFDRWWLQYLNGDFMSTLETDPIFHGLRDLFSWMKSYFDACSDSLKPCIFYLSIFYAEKNIRLRRLLWRWIAEGYCRDTSDGTTCEENGAKYISELVRLSIIQKSASNKAFCQINGFFHEYIMSRPMEDNLVFALEERCSLNSARAGQHLTIRSSWDRDEAVYEIVDFSRLRSLTVFGEWESFFISSQKVNMRLLRVLDLEDATDVTNEDLEQIAKVLHRLKFLSIRGHKKINCLPSSVGGLRQLQTLDIRHTSIVTLPLAITKLHKLRYIRAGTSDQVWDWEGGGVINVVVPADGGVDRASSAAQGDVVVPADGGEEERASSSAQAAVTDLPEATIGGVPADGGEEKRASSSAQAAVTDLPEATIGGGGTNSTALVLAADAAACSSSLVSCNNSRARTLLSSLLRRRGGRLDNNNNGSVKVPAGIKNLAALHTLGVVNVNNGTCGKSILEELQKLTQLCKLGVSGINKRNIHEFFCAISGLGHLKSLSVEVVEKEDDGNRDELADVNIPEPPNTLKSLKLYGHANTLLPVWISRFRGILEKLQLDHTILKAEQWPALPRELRMSHLRIRSIQDGERLHIHRVFAFAGIVEIWCSSISVLHIHFDDSDNGVWEVEVLKVHFSDSEGSQSSVQLRISGMSHFMYLKEVWLKGYTEAHKQYMEEQIPKIDRWWEGQKRPVLKLVQPRSS